MKWFRKLRRRWYCWKYYYCYHHGIKLEYHSHWDGGEYVCQQCKTERELTAKLRAVALENRIQAMMKDKD